MRNPKQELSPKALETLKAQILKMPTIDRVALLSFSAFDDRVEAYFASAGMIALACHMAEQYSVKDKVRLAEALRGHADVLDHELFVEEVVRE